MSWSKVYLKIKTVINTEFIDKLRKIDINEKSLIINNIKERNYYLNMSEDKLLETIYKYYLIIP